RRCEALQGLARRRQLEVAGEADLTLQLDAELLQRPSPGFGHQRERVDRLRLARVLDEVPVARRDLRTPDAVALEAARLEQPAGRQLVLGILEDAAEGALVRGLGGLALGLQLGDRALDLVRMLRRQPELDPSYHLPGPQ